VCVVLVIYGHSAFVGFLRITNEVLPNARKGTCQIEFENNLTEVLTAIHFANQCHLSFWMQRTALASEEGEVKGSGKFGAYSRGEKLSRLPYQN
jgi:hypothetical protein